MKVKAINSFEEYTQYTEKHKKNFFFRGQINAEWNIEPSILRKTENIKSLSEEQKAISECVYNSSNENSYLSIPKPLATLFYIQHYGGGTRICDLTTRPFVALFFATEENEEHNNKDGAVYIIDGKNTISGDSDEIKLFAKVLDGTCDISTLQSDVNNFVNVENILTQNYIINPKDMFFNNMRSIYQGGTGIVFGFGYENGNLKLTGDTDVIDLIRTKIIIPKQLKTEIRAKLKENGYTKERLYDFPKTPVYDDVSFQEEEFSDRRMGNFYWVEGCYCISTNSFDKNKLKTKINNLCKNLSNKYGNNVRINAFFYCDETDKNHANYICKVNWKEKHGNKTIWNDNYRLKRNIYMNEEWPKHECISDANIAVNDMYELYNKIKINATKLSNKIENFIECVKSMRQKIIEADHKIANIGSSNDTATNNLVEKANAFASEVKSLVDDIINQLNFNKSDGAFWCLIKNDFKRCENSYSDFISVILFL